MNFANYRIALVHDYLKEYGGAESVLETLSDIYPQADIFTSVYLPKFFGPHQSRLTKKWQARVHTSFLQYLPFKAKLISLFRFISPLAFKSFNFSSYHLIITSATGAYFPNALNKGKAKLICYCHTPPRYLYGLATARDLKSAPILNFFAQIAFHFLRLLDFKYAQNVDQFISNSATTLLRIQKFYRKDAIVINPPVYLAEASAKADLSHVGVNHDSPFNKRFYLAGGRLARAKRYDIAILACNKLKLPLKIFGRDFAGHLDELKAIAGPTVEFLGEVNQAEKTKLFTNAQAYFMCSDNEDFGIVTVEAMAHGTPVIGYNSGGVAETVIDGKTGVLFDNLTPDSCVKAIQKFQKLFYSRHCEQSEAISKACISQAQKFSPQVFTSKIKKLIYQLV